MRKVLDKLSLAFLIVICLTLGLAPFTPEPHVWQKLKMLVSGELSQLMDLFDLLLHGSPWLLLIFKLSMRTKVKNSE